ncbi:hypothetical protein pb186bvf_016248 [Paramecium bursaria]
MNICYIQIKNRLQVNIFTEYTRKILKEQDVLKIQGNLQAILNFI